MQKGKIDAGGAAMILAAVAIIVAVMAISGGGQYSAVQTGSQLTSVGAQVCPTDLKTQVGVYAIETVMKTNGEEQVVTEGGSAYIYRNGDTQKYDTLTLTSDGTYVWSTTNKELECGQDTFKLIVGGPENRSGTGYYFTETDEFTASRAQENVKVKLDQIGQIKMNASNATTLDLGYITSDALAQDVAAGQTVKDIYLTLRETRGGVVRAPILCFDYPTSIFEEISVIDGSSVTVPTNMSGYESCYTIGVNQISDYDSLRVPLKLVVKSTATVAANQFNISILDKGTYISDAVLYNDYEDLNDLGTGALDGDGSGSATPFNVYYL